MTEDETQAAEGLGRRVHGVGVHIYRRQEAPPDWILRVVRNQLLGVERSALVGLDAVVIRSSSELTRRERERFGRGYGKKGNNFQPLGAYYARSRKRSAYIELFWDNIAIRWPAIVYWFPFFRELAVAATLFHEIGHHLHQTRAEDRRDKEMVAEEWRRKLNGRYLRRRYWYLFPLLFPLGLLSKRLKTRAGRSNRKHATG